MNDKIKAIIDKLWLRIKDKKYKFGFCCAIVFLIIPILIWFAYFIGDIWWGIPTHITAGDALMFYGSFLAFLGTVALGSLALWQNHRLSKRNVILEERKSLPILTIDKKAWGHNGNFQNYYLTINNISSNPAKNIKVSNINFLNSNNACIAFSDKMDIEKDALCQNESAILKFNNARLSGKNITCQFCLYYDDILNKTHKLHFLGSIMDSSAANLIQFSIHEEEQ